jgi:endonuclease/exonuclease/phosphatase family metal-dependent hydrolase
VEAPERRVSRGGVHRGSNPSGSPGEPEKLAPRFVILALLVLIACAPRVPGPQANRGPARLVVITWNMHAGAGDIARLVDDLTAGRVTGVPPRDYVLLLQEAVQDGPHDPAIVARARRLSTFYVPVRQLERGVSGNAILSTLPLVNTRTIPLPRARQTRAAAEASIVVDDERLFVVNAHLENRLGLLRGLFSDTARGRQAEALLRQIPTGPGIAGGDLNTWLGPHEPAWQEFLARFPDTPGGRRAPTFHDRLVLDHLFFDLPAGWRVRRRVLQTRYGSDHNPVMGVIETQ